MQPKTPKKKLKYLKRIPETQLLYFDFSLFCNVQQFVRRCALYSSLCHSKSSEIAFI